MFGKYFNSYSKYSNQFKNNLNHKYFHDNETRQPTLVQLSLYRGEDCSVCTEIKFSAEKFHSFLL